MEGGSSCKGTVCVTGGTGYVASWLIMRLLEHGYSVNSTIRSSPVRKRDVSYLTDLPGASKRLRIFNASLDEPDSFGAAIDGCIGVFHLAHPIDFEGKETEKEITKKSINGALGILQACLNSKTVKRVVYISSATAVMLNGQNLDTVDESTWSDVHYIQSLNMPGAGYSISKTLTEKACLEFAEKHGLDLVTIIPTWLHGPFVGPNLPGNIRRLMAMIFGDQEPFKNRSSIPFVHTDDVARAHIFLFEYPDAKGRYICSALEITVYKLYEFLSARYPEYHIQPLNLSVEITETKFPAFSSKKLLDTGFNYRYGLEEMYDEAIQCCKQRGLL